MVWRHSQLQHMTSHLMDVTLDRVKGPFHYNLLHIFLTDHFAGGGDLEARD